MKITKLYLFLLAGILIFLTSTAYRLSMNQQDNLKMKHNMFSAEKYDNSKLIKFDHKLHNNEAGIKCEECHISASASVTSKDNLNPKEATCGTCHDIKDEKNCNFCHINSKYKKLKSTDREILFSHKYHIETEKKLCLDCHVGLDKVKYSKESLSGFPKMETCFGCHNTPKSSGNCESCHLNLTNRIPQNHSSPNFLNEHKIADVSSGKNNCMMCHSDNFCQVCHSTNTFKGNNTKNDFFAPFYTKEGATRRDRAALQKLSTVHDLNYRFTHGLDANQKSFECKTCHEPVTFCTSCHQNEGELVTGFLPKSHQQPNFTTIGVNTGGGLHSELARRDIESCQSCHSVEGADPTCLKCHFDNDGVKGTNPKTHEYGFLKDEKGLWHDTQGAICYTCHSDANAKPNGNKGVGFCGYCH